MAKRKKVSTTIYIEADQLDGLKALSERTKVPMAEYIRQAIDLILDKNKETRGDVQQPA